ncbi:tetratricopeptide repeat protein [Candidatus Sumerlaeota bacterium]|nr:tetratricopeptide repeat protein [Candidatus Sumerlaeota bacterium]
MNGQSLRIASSLLQIFLLFLIIFIVFSPCLSGEFLWDDELLIAHNPGVKSLRNIPGAFVRTFFHKSHETPGISYYRPIVTVINILQYAIFGLRPFWWHLFNLVLHIINAILFYFFLIKILNIKRRVGFWIALLFGIHPVHAEAVCFISGRTDVIALFFILSSLSLYFKGKGNHGIYRTASILFFILGLLSKELVLMFPLALMAMEYVRSADSPPGTWYKKDFPLLLKSLIPYFIACAVYVIIRFVFISGIETPYYPTGRMVTAWLTMPKVFLRYLFLLIATTIYDTVCDYTNFFRIETAIFSFGFLIPFCGILATALMILRLFLKKQREFLGIFWFLIFLFPVLNILPLGIWMAERYLYIPLIGFCLFLLSLESAIEKRGVPLYIILAFIVIGSIGTIQRSFLWRDAATLWSHAVERNPDNPQARVIYAEVLVSRGRYDEAIKQLEQVKPIDTGERKILPASLSLAKAQTLVKIYLAKKEYENAEECLSAAEKILPSSAQNSVLKARMFLEQENLEKAREAFENALEINPDLLSALSGLMETKDQLRHPPEEILVLAEKAVKINPDYAPSYLYRGKAQSELGILKEAEVNFEKFTSLAPNAPEGYLFLADVYEQMGRKDKTYILKAMRTYDALLLRHPDNIEGLNNLGILFAVIGEKQKAEELWKRVLAIKPGDETARENLGKLNTAQDK